MPSDHRLTAARRSGDRVAELTERLRQGSLTREALELAAYCGDEAARALCTKPLDPDYSTDAAGGLSAWSAGLWRWPGALERAALAACEVWVDSRRQAWVRDGFPSQIQGLGAAVEALQAARAHIEAPSEATRLRCAECWATQSLDLPTTRLCGGLDGVHSPRWPNVVISEAARLSSPDAVRAGICAALIGWALGDQK